MKKYISLFAILMAIILIAFSFKNQDGKIGPHLSYVLKNTNANNFAVYIYLKDKGPNAEQMLSNPLSLVTQRSLDRRSKVRVANDLVDINDVPLYNPYIQEISTKASGLRQQLKAFNAVTADITREQLSDISNLNYVIQIELIETFVKNKNFDENQTMQDNTVGNYEKKNNIEVDSLNYGSSGSNQITQMNVNLVHDQGIYGQGILIASLDDGFRFQTHQAFTNSANPIQIVSQYDFQLHLVGANHTLDTHGSTTIACIAAYDPGNMIGTAFKSKFLVARTEVDSFEHHSEMDNWSAAEQWADSLGADVITSSLGYLVFDAGFGPNYTYQNMNGMDVPVTRSAALAAHNGITVFNSAGNDGPNASHNTLGAPADADSILTLGAVTSTGTVASFSSVGPTTDNPPRIKPDVMAKGQNVYTVDYNTGIGYSGSSGTSYSCPLAAGVGALILSANKSLTPLQVRGILRKFANNSANPNNTYGWGIINAANSVDSARKLDTQPPVITHTQPFTSTSNTGVITMRARITDNGIIRRWTNQSPRCWYRTSTNGGVSWSANNFLDYSYYNNADSFFYAIPGQPVGTTVQYYFAAQDIALPTPLMSTLPAGGSGVNPPGTTPPSTRFQYIIVAVGITQNYNEIPKEYKLYNNYPNPFNPSTKIKFDIAQGKGQSSHVKLVVYDILGRAVSSLIDGELKPGSYEVDFKGENFASGIYFYKLETESFVDTKKMLMIK